MENNQNSIREETLPSRDQYDVVILGGGLAGLSLALQLKQTNPEIQVLVLERNTHPVPEAAHKVGESLVEVGAYYFSRILGMKEHIDQHQLPKLGLRFFFTANKNEKIEERVEFGPHSFPTEDIFSYQLDRGRFENALGEKIKQLGVTFSDNSRVKDVVLNKEKHIVTFSSGGIEKKVTASWVVDATSRPGIIKRQLGLEEAAGHHANAAWFRIASELDIHTWCTDPEWQARVPGANRRLSTNHLLGPGYWVWLIPLASGSTSVGIVTDAEMHPFDTINTFDRALQWLYAHEPQCANVVTDHRDELQDFRVLKQFSHSCKQVYSTDRWCLTGEAGAFLDPFYSPGSDFIAMSNSFITQLITNDLNKKDISEQVEIYNQTYLNFYHQAAHIYEGQYPIMGSSQVMQTKIVWDSLIYAGHRALLFLQNKLIDEQFIKSVARDLKQYAELEKSVQQFFKEWSALDQREWHNSYSAVQDLQLMDPLVEGLFGERSDDELRAILHKNLKWSEQVAVGFFLKAIELLPNPPQLEKVNPYALSLNPDRWQADGLSTGEAAINIQDVNIPGIEKVWLDSCAVPAL